MTVPLTSSSFDERAAHPLRMHPPRPAVRGRVGALLVTALIHVTVVAGLVLGVHATAPLLHPPPMIVHIEAQKRKPLPTLALPAQPALIRPRQITAPVPDVVIRTESHPIVATTRTVPPPPVAAAPASAAAAPRPGRDAFLNRLLARLNQVKRYPLAARRAHVQGVVMLHFVMDATGRVTESNIAKSSGYAVLDDEALAIIQRAQPLPPLPADFPTRILNAVVPITFSLNE